jgi:Fic family protein
MSQIQELLERVDSAKAELDGLRPLDREQEDRVMQKFRLWWTYHSNAIEGNSLTQGETEMFLMEGLTAKGKPLKDHLDLRGHSNAINYLLGFIHDKEVLAEAAIRKLHEVLLVEPYQVQAITPDGLPTMKTVALGQYKTQPNHVRTPTGETHFYATPEETPAKMQDLMTWYRDETAKGAMHPVAIAARFHHRFTEIHPFDDGNGRMSRLLMNLMLMQAGYPPAVIRIGERDQYLAALRLADREEYDDFLSFIAEHVVSSLEIFLRATKGEEIHEPTDLEKEIALLKIELRHIEEPEVLTQEVQKRLFANSFDPLLAGVVKLMNPLCELFSKGIITASARYGQGQMSASFEANFPFSETNLSSRIGPCWDQNCIIRFVALTFALNGFKKARFDTFDISSALEFIFEPPKYSLILRSTSPPLTIQHFYQDPLTKDEITEVAQKLTRFFVDAIKKKTNGHS